MLSWIRTQMDNWQDRRVEALLANIHPDTVRLFHERAEAARG